MTMGDLVMSTMGQSADTPPLNKSQLDALLTGNTVYLPLPPGGPGGPDGGTAAFYFGADGRASLKLPTGTLLVGPWTLGDDHYRCEWENGPKNSCSRIVKVNGAMLTIDHASGTNRGPISSIVPGNAEGL